MKKGLYLEFEIKRPNRINRYMDYLAVIGVAIFAFVFIVYLPYTSKIETKNQVTTSYNTAYSTLQNINSQKVEDNSNTTAYDKDYQNSYNVIGDAILPYQDYFDSILDFTGDFKDSTGNIGMFEIKSLTFNTRTSSLTMRVEDTSGGNHMSEYIRALSEDKTDESSLAWVKSVAYDKLTYSAEVTITYGK